MPRTRGPSTARQGERLAPQFAALQDALAGRRISAGDTADEQDPELVVVFDLAGTVAEFARAVSGVDGLEFLAEMVDEDAEPDDEFVKVDPGGRERVEATETLFAVMSDARAGEQLVRLFARWQADPEASFERGLAPLKAAFTQLRAVRRWGPADRIRETGLQKAWEEDVEVVGGQGAWRVEIELWFRSDERKRAAAQSQVVRLVTDARGTVLSTSTLPAIRYHALLVELPPNQIEAVLAEGAEAIDLLASEMIAFVSPAQPMGLPGAEPAEAAPPVSVPLPAERRPRTALLDGLPMANHVTLAGRLVVDDPDDVVSRYTGTAQQQHGTAMASLICHGDLSDLGSPLSTSLYVRPVMEPHPHHATETLVRDRLLVDLVHRAFHRMFEGDGGQPPAAPSVRIVNLSLGDPARVFVRRISPLATLLDWLAHQYNVLILVSSGNHPRPPLIALDQAGDLDGMTAAMRTALHGEARQRRLLSPAEAVNVVTVGAVHDDAADPPASDTVIDVVGRGMPAAYSAAGTGYRRSVKPDILLPGGRQTYLRPLPGQVDAPLVPARQSLRGPGILVASPGTLGADATAYRVGTSNATALATRAVHEIFDVLEEHSGSEGGVFPDAQYFPVLAKALLVHGAGWGDLAPSLTETLGLTRSGLTQVLGYGRVDPDRVASATRHRAVLIGAGSIMDKQRDWFSLPLPPALSSTTEWRRLTLTLAWLSPINPGSRPHRMSRLALTAPKVAFGVELQQAEHHAARRGTVQHEILEGRRALAFVAGDAVSVDVECHIESGWADSAVRYGLVASIEMATTVHADIHTEIRDALRAQAVSRTRVTPRG